MFLIDHRPKNDYSNMQHFKAICAKYPIKPGVSTIKIIEARYWTRT